MAHNAPFDVGFIYYDLARLKMNTSNKTILDTYAMAKKLFPNLYCHGLESLVSSMHIRFETLHRALADAKVCMEIFYRCLDKIGDYEHLTMQNIIDISGPAISLNVEQ